MQFDHNNPLMVPTGSDSFQNIGGPAVSDDDFNRLTARNPVDLWKHAFLNHFPPEVRLVVLKCFLPENELKSFQSRMFVDRHGVLDVVLIHFMETDSCSYIFKFMLIELYIKSEFQL